MNPYAEVRTKLKQDHILFVFWRGFLLFLFLKTIVNAIVDPSRRGAGNSTLYIFLDLGMGLGMIMMGYVAQYSNISATFILSSVITALGFDHIQNRNTWIFSQLLSLLFQRNSVPGP